MRMPPLVEVASACWRLPHLQTSEGQLQEAQAPTAEMSEVAAWPTTPFCAIALEDILTEVSIIGWLVGWLFPLEGSRLSELPAKVKVW